MEQHSFSVTLDVSMLVKCGFAKTIKEGIPKLWDLIISEKSDHFGSNLYNLQGVFTYNMSEWNQLFIQLLYANKINKVIDAAISS